MPCLFIAETIFSNDAMLGLMYTIMFSFIQEIVPFQFKRSAAISAVLFPPKKRQMMSQSITQSAGFLL